MTLASKILPILAVAGTMMVAPGAMMLDRDCCDVLLPATAARYLQGRARRLRWRTVHVRCRTMPAYWLTRARNGRYGYIANVIMRIASPLAALLVTAHRLSVPATTNPFLGVPGRRLADRGFGPGAAVCPPRAPISRMAAEAAGRSIPGPDDHRALVERCEAADEWSSLLPSPFVMASRRSFAPRLRGRGPHRSLAENHHRFTATVHFRAGDTCAGVNIKLRAITRRLLPI